MEVHDHEPTVEAEEPNLCPTKSTPRPFERAFMRHLEPRSRILDLGCGRRAQHARELVAAGFIVDAVDQQPLLDDPPAGLHFVQSSIEAWTFSLTDERWNGVLMAGILHFLDPVFALSTLLPRLKQRVNPGGVIGISTFYEEPDPPLPVRTRSLYTVERLSVGFQDWKTEGQERVLPNGTSMSGTTHKFSKTLFITRAPASSA